MGGGASLYYGLNYGSGLAGVFCLSSFLAQDSNIYKVQDCIDTPYGSLKSLKCSKSSF